MGECPVAPSPQAPSSPPGPRDPNLVLYVPEMEEIRISPVIARKGYLNVLEHKTHTWKKRWVVSFERSVFKFFSYDCFFVLRLCEDLMYLYSEMKRIL